MKMLSFQPRRHGDGLYIDWAAAGGEGCRPANIVEVDMYERIEVLERLVTAMANAKSDEARERVARRAKRAVRTIRQCIAGWDNR